MPRFVMIALLALAAGALPAVARADNPNPNQEAAKQICAQCRVRGDCLDFAVRVKEPHGIWGGLTEVERRTLFPEADL